jgi:hypothetical protein
MITKAEQARQREDDLARALVAGLDNETLLALADAATAQAAVFDVIAKAVPEQRRQAALLRKVVPLLERAVMARKWIEAEANS